FGVALAASRQLNDADGHYLARALVVVNFEHPTHLLQGGRHRLQRAGVERGVLQERIDCSHGFLLGSPFPFQSSHHLLKAPQETERPRAPVRRRPSNAQWRAMTSL